MLIPEQELFLQRLGIVKARFTLNSASNLAPRKSLGNSPIPFTTDYLSVLRDLHYTLDKLGFFAITCSRTSLEAMIIEVDKENIK